jgi:hypothetical protein
MKYIVPILLAICFLIIIAAAAFHICGLTLNLEIKPVDLATLIVYVFIAVFLQYYLATRINDLRVEKNLLIDDVRDAISVLRSCRDTFSMYYESKALTKQNKTSILGMLRTLANRLDSLETSISLSNVAKGKKDLHVPKKSYIDYKMVLTGGDFPVKAYGPSMPAEHDRAYRSLQNELKLLLFKINKAS